MCTHRYCRQSRIWSARGTDKTIISNFFLLILSILRSLIIIIISFSPSRLCVFNRRVHTHNRLRRRLMDANWSPAADRVDRRRTATVHCFPVTTSRVPSPPLQWRIHTRARSRLTAAFKIQTHTADDHSSCRIAVAPIAQL